MARARQLSGSMVKAVGHLKALRDLLNAPTPFRSPYPFAIGQRKLYIGSNVESRYQMKALEHKAEIGVAEMRQTGVGQCAALLTENRHCAFGRLIEQSDNIQQRRLAAAARAHDTDKLTGFNLEVDILQRGSLDFFGAVDFFDTA